MGFKFGEKLYKRIFGTCHKMIQKPLKEKIETTIMSTTKSNMSRQITNDLQVPRQHTKLNSASSFELSTVSNDPSIGSKEDVSEVKIKSIELTDAV